MKFNSVKEFLTSSEAKSLPAGPIGLIFDEDSVALGQTIQHHQKLGFKSLIVISNVTDVSGAEGATHLISCDSMADFKAYDVINAFISVFAGRWIYYCYNAEFLYYPFSEMRSVDELVNFTFEERRSAIFTMAVDVYAKNLNENADGVALDDAGVDRTGYFSEGRMRNGDYQAHQANVFGGLKWRYEQYLPKSRLRQDRISFFKAKAGLEMDQDFLFNDETYNTYSCGWHNNVTASIVTFRTAKYLRSNPRSTHEISTFACGQSEEFKWNSKQLMDMGFMEPGQWF